MSSASPDAAFANRLSKNARHLARWVRRESVEAWRIYDRDIPEFPYAVDRYGDYLHVQYFAGKRDIAASDMAQHLDTIGRVLDVPAERVTLKVRARQRGDSQYEKLDETAPSFIVNEDGLRFEVNLGRYLDTGLFLDHRELRKRIRSEAQGQRVLNLFAYTGSFTVYAAAGQAAATTTVDLSRTYQDWTRRNLQLNGFSDTARHQLVAADVLAWLATAAGRETPYGLIVLDPPSFSNSKRMTKTFDVQRDHVALVTAAAALLAPGGALYFSNNRQGFRLDDGLAARFEVQDLGMTTVPPDFRRRRPHQCWRIVKPDH